MYVGSVLSFYISHTRPNCLLKKFPPAANGHRICVKSKELYLIILLAELTLRKWGELDLIAFFLTKAS